MTKEELLEGLKKIGMKFEIENVDGRELLIIEKSATKTGGYDLNELLKQANIALKVGKLGKDAIFKMIKEVADEKSIENIEGKVMTKEGFTLYIGLEKRENNDLIKKEMGENDLILMAYKDEGKRIAIAKMKKGIEKEIGIEESELWKMALHNVKMETIIESMDEHDTDEDRELYKDYLKNFIVVTNKNRKLGAAGAFHPDILKELGKRLKTNRVGIALNTKDLAIAFPYSSKTCGIIQEKVFPGIRGEMPDTEDARKISLNDEIVVIDLEK